MMIGTFRNSWITRVPVEVVAVGLALLIGTVAAITDPTQVLLRGVAAALGFVLAVYGWVIYEEEMSRGVFDALFGFILLLVAVVPQEAAQAGLGTAMALGDAATAFTLLTLRVGLAFFPV